MASPDREELDWVERSRSLRRNKGIAESLAGRGGGSDEGCSRGAPVCGARRGARWRAAEYWLSFLSFFFPSSLLFYNFSFSAVIAPFVESGIWVYGLRCNRWRSCENFAGHSKRVALCVLLVCLLVARLTIAHMRNVIQEWKVLNPFKLKARCALSCMNRGESTTHVVKVGFQLYRARNLFVIDVQKLHGQIFPFMDLCAQIAKELRLNEESNLSGAGTPETGAHSYPSSALYPYPQHPQLTILQQQQLLHQQQQQPFK